MNQTQLRAFVIMPFDPEFDAVYLDLIVAPLSDAGFLVERADDVEARQNVLVDVVRGIAEADLIIGDLTTLNPNVFYELGLAHAMGVPTILIAQQDSADDIPFDLRQYRTEFYDTHFQRAKTIAEMLGKLGRAHAAGTLKFGSPISDFLRGATPPAIHAERTGAVGAASRERTRKGPQRPINEQPGGGEAEPESGTSEDERGLLDFLDAVSQGSEALSDVADGIVESTERVESQLATLKERIEALDTTSATAATHGKRLLLQAAQVLDGYAERLESSRPEFEGAVDNITSSGLGYLTLLAESPEEWRDEIQSALETSSELRDIVEQASTEIAAMRDAVAGLPPLIKQTNRARNRTVRALDALLAQFDRVRSYSEQSIGLAQAGLDQLVPGTPVRDDEDESAPNSM